MWFWLAVYSCSRHFNYKLMVHKGILRAQLFPREWEDQSQAWRRSLMGCGALRDNALAKHVKMLQCSWWAHTAAACGWQNVLNGANLSQSCKLDWWRHGSMWGGSKLAHAFFTKQKQCCLRISYLKLAKSLSHVVVGWL